MKIGTNNGSVISLDNYRKTQEAQNAKATASEKAISDSVSTEASQALLDALEAIARSGLAIDDIHSKVDSQKAQGLLVSMGEGESRPKMSESEILQLAEKVADEIFQNPYQAAGVFNKIDPERVATLTQF